VGFDLFMLPRAFPDEAFEAFLIGVYACGEFRDGLVPTRSK
jgi:hypothetical protein